MYNFLFLSHVTAVSKYWSNTSSLLRKQTKEQKLMKLKFLTLLSNM